MTSRTGTCVDFAVAGATDSWSSTGGTATASCSRADGTAGAVYTLAFAMLVVLVTADIYFAATVPLAFAVKKPGFLVLASSTLALLGIRSLYWWVTSLEVDRVKLRIALAIVLWLVGARAGAGADLPRSAGACPSWCSW